MGFTPEQVGAMTFWELDCCLEGWQAAHATGDAPAAIPTADELRKFMALPSVMEGPVNANRA